MKRSEINGMISEAISFFTSMNFNLPPWGYWTLSDWKQCSENYYEITHNMLGWDLTDFGSGQFREMGLLLFNIRNGNPRRDKKSYAEKIMIVEEGQHTPMHFHWSKMEDIINRGGGNLMMQLYASDEKEQLADHPFEVSIDGMLKILHPGEIIRLRPGESITLGQGLYHGFFGEAGSGKVLVGEVSEVNDDHNDNRFHLEVGRFPDIEEDVLPLHLLVNDYASFL